MQTCLTAMRLGVVIYFVPLFFLFQPALLFQGDLTPLIWVLPSILAGIVLMAGGLEGWLVGAGRVQPWLRAPLALAGFAFSFPGLLTTLVAGLVSAVLILLVRQGNRNVVRAAA